MQPSDTTKTSPSRAQRVTFRAILLGALLIPPNCWFVLHGYFFGNSRPTTVSLFINVVVTLLILGFINRFVARRMPGKELLAGELVTIYAMLSVSSALCGLDQIQTLAPVVAYPHHHATPENDWQHLFLKDMPVWLAVTDVDTLGSRRRALGRPSPSR